MKSPVHKRNKKNFIKDERNNSIDGVVKMDANNSFFEENPNHLFDYLNINKDAKNDFIVYKKGISIKTSKDENLKRKASTIEEVNKLMSLYNLKKEIKKDRFFFDEKSPRDKNEDSNVEQEEQYSGEKKDEDYIAEEEAFKENMINNVFDEDDVIKNIKKKKELNLFNAKEINDLKYYKRTRQVPKDYDIITEERRDELLDLVKSRKAIVNNNVLLIKPQIFPSQKQVNFDNTKHDNKNMNYFYLMMKKQQDQNKKIDQNDINFKIKNFEMMIDKVKENKYKQKLENGLYEYGDYLNNSDYIDRDIIPVINESLESIEYDPKRAEYINDKNEASNGNTKRIGKIKVIESNKQSCHSTKNIIDTKTKKEDNTSWCQKLTNLFLGDPLRSYASEKRIWGSEQYGAFHKDFQDKRIYFNVPNKKKQKKIIPKQP